MGVHNLITGLNGHGKTLMLVADVLLPLSTSTMDYKGKQIPRRLVVGGIRELVIPHELMEVEEIDLETWRDEWYEVKRIDGTDPLEFVVRVEYEFEGKTRRVLRAPGDVEGCRVIETDIPVVCMAVNWWVWCQPGDVIVIDEAQRLFRPMASGRRVPRFIAKLETARHYAVELYYLTQFAALLHSNLRSLVGPHRHIERVYGGTVTTVTEWPRVNTALNKRDGTVRVWKHPKKAFGLYRSAEAHTRFGMRLPLAVYVVVPAFGLLAWLGFVIYGRMQERFHPPAIASASAGASSPAARSGQAAPGRPSGPRWPAYDAGPVVAKRDPFEGRAVQWEGGYSVGAQKVGYFGVLVDGERVATITLAQLVRMGYRWTEIGPCAGLLASEAGERMVTCAKRSTDSRNAPTAQAGASAPERSS